MDAIYLAHLLPWKTSREVHQHIVRGSTHVEKWHLLNLLLGSVKRVLQRSIAEKKFILYWYYHKGVWGLRTTGWQGMKLFLIVLKSWTNIHPLPWGFLIERMSVSQGLVEETMRFCVLYSSMIVLIPAKASGFKGCFLTLGKAYQGQFEFQLGEMNESTQCQLWTLPRVSQGLLWGVLHLCYLPSFQASPKCKTF